MPTMLEAKNGIIVCASPLRPDSPFATSAGGVGYEDVPFSVALNTVDFVGNANVTFRYYDHLLASISPQGGHLQGGTSAVLYGDRFAPLVSQPHPTPTPNSKPNPEQVRSARLAAARDVELRALSLRIA